MSDRRPAEVFPPGEFLQDELDARGWTQTELAEIIGRPPRVVNEIVAGKRAITPETASDLAAAFGTSPHFWMNLETAYQLAQVPPRHPAVAKLASLHERFPVRELAKRGWIDRAASADALEAALLAFFGLPDRDAPLAFRHAARRDYGRALSPVQIAWLCRVRQLAAALEAPPFARERLEAAVPALEGLMRTPEQAAEAAGLLRETGVRLVFVEPVPGSRIHGACFWLDETAPVIGLSLKGDHIDRFWFNLWHEIAHVLRGDGRDEAMLDTFEDEAEAEDERERAANEWAAERCVPSSAMDEFFAAYEPLVSERALAGFARSVGRHPGIVAGQIQKRTGRWDLFRKHQVRIRYILVDAAPTDGYGRSPPVRL